MLRTLLQAALLLVPGIAHADWYEATSKHFVVYSDDKPEAVEKFTERLERFDQALRLITGTPDTPISERMKVHVYVVDDVDAVQKLVGRDGVAGFFVPRYTGPTAFVPREDGNRMMSSQGILLHEYGHAFMFSSWPSAVFPKWFVEGFAEFVGTAIFRSDGSLVIGKSPEYRGYRILSSEQLPAARMLKLDPGKLDDLQTHILYGRGWLLTHYSLLGGHPQELIAYIGAINSGKSIEEASKAFGDPGRLDGKLNGYAQRKALPAITLPKDKVPTGDIALRKMRPAEGATMPVLIRSAAGVNEKTAPGAAAAARRVAASFPADPFVQNELAEAEFDAKNYAAAEAAADRALAAEPNSIHALLYKGMAQMAALKAAKSKDAEKWKEVRGWFVKANRLDPEYPAPLVAFYDAFVTAGMKPSVAAEDGLLAAYLKAPYDDDLRGRAGKILLERDNISAARIAFEKVAYGPHQSEDNLALKVINALDKDGREGALKVIADAEEKARKAEADGNAKAKTN